MSNYTVAIIGTGRVGAQFDFVPELPDNHADAVAVSDSFTLVAGVNRGRAKLDLFGKRYGIDALYHDYRQMLDEVGPDVCIVATHPRAAPGDGRWMRRRADDAGDHLRKAHGAVAGGVRRHDRRLQERRRPAADQPQPPLARPLAQGQGARSIRARSGY